MRHGTEIAKYDGVVNEAAYDRIGRGYSNVRRADPRIAARVEEALGDARTVLNVGAGTGSYEPADRKVTAVEPSAEMIAQRPAGSATVVQASAEALPFDDDSFDAAMAIITVQHWADAAAGLAEMIRVSRERVLVLTFDGPAMAEMWMVRDYVPRLLEIHTELMPPMAELAAALPGAGSRRSQFPASAGTASSAHSGTGPRCISTPGCVAPVRSGT